MPSTATQSAPAPRKNLIEKLEDFWQRISEGIALQQLWNNFKDEAHSTYRLYSADVARSGRLDAVPKKHRNWEMMKEFFWAVLMKLSPPRRVALLVALVFLFVPSASFTIGSNTTFELDESLFHLISVLLLLGLLVAEIADRVTMKRDLQIAREIQGWLVPEAPPVVAGYEFAFTMRPANTVAGDYYDIFFRPANGSAAANHPGPEKLLIVMADVAGKSMPAALLMAGLQASVRTLAAADCSLPQLMEGLNRHCCQQSQEGRRFTTCFLAELDPATGEFQYFNAGHNAPVLLRANGLERLESLTIPLGIERNLQFAPQSARLGAGDLLVLFTDGLVEAEDLQGQEYGEQRLLPLILAFKNPGANELMQTVMRDVERFVARAQQHDDMTCLVAKKQ